MGISRGSYVTDGEMWGANQRAVLKFKIWNRDGRLPILDACRQLKERLFWHSSISKHRFGNSSAFSAALVRNIVTMLSLNLY
jgi:hypothetical protein